MMRRDQWLDAALSALFGYGLALIIFGDPLTAFAGLAVPLIERII